MLAKKTSKNQITLPKAIVKQLPEVEYFEVSLRKGEVVLRPVEVSVPEEKVKAVRAKIRSLGLTEKVVEQAIRWARGRQTDARRPGYEHPHFGSSLFRYRFSARPSVAIQTHHYPALRSDSAGIPPGPHLSQVPLERARGQRTARRGVVAIC